MKRACDRCINRKVRCDGSLPCVRCSSRPGLSCTYLTPTRKRGPKFSRLRHLRVPFQDRPTQCTEKDERSRLVECHDVRTSTLQIKEHDSRIPLVVLETIIEAYETRMFPVWPVIGSESLLQQLRKPGDCIDAYVVATALSAATMAQLHLPPMRYQSQMFASEDIERECRRVRATSEYREQPDLRGVLTSFFLHVYHAKVDNQNSALLYIQEAIALARLLHLDEDEDERSCENGSCDELANGKIIYLLLWVTERGYAIQYGLPISLHHTVSLSSIKLSTSGTCIQGLINLASLFVTFDSSSIPQFSRYKEFPVSKDQLVGLEKIFANTPAPLKHLSVAQQADFLATKNWMQTLLWQQAMSRGFLSSSSECEFMTFRYPARVARESLMRIRLFSTGDLIPLGRDQLVKLFEVANTLADVLLCNTQLAKHSSGQLGPQDFLHGLYQFISPMLELDGACDSMLRQKTAEVLVRTPTRFWQLESGTMSDNEWMTGTKLLNQ
ncbi:related to C6 transcription factor [Phialocephala subalpina]|uniref:Related to C6 transcription factor n=1 Tax=Phialocephala subalpina TaxID=576137 RepID=A0A1L7XVE1_9HELO|nr:related to C6 transcription factor [Phialocephala subalpina]